MPFACINGINIHYQIAGEGPPLLLFAPGGFRSVLLRWTAEGGKGVFQEMDALRTLARHFTVIAYDRRESGLSGGRIASVGGLAQAARVSAHATENTEATTARTE